jgi:hypothetical protein
LNHCSLNFGIPNESQTAQVGITDEMRFMEIGAFPVPRNPL